MIWNFDLRRELDFHGKIRGLARPENFDKFLAEAARPKWVVYSKRPFAGPETVLKYLSRYTLRSAPLSPLRPARPQARRHPTQRRSQQGPAGQIMTRARASSRSTTIPQQGNRPGPRLTRSRRPKIDETRAPRLHGSREPGENERGGNGDGGRIVGSRCWRRLETAMLSPVGQ